MSGVAGIIHFNITFGRSGDGMCDAIVHRRPDDFGQYVDGTVGIGTQRLSIIDLETRKQPITSADGTICVLFNSGTYNYCELRKGLEAKVYRFRTATDTEEDRQ